VTLRKYATGADALPAYQAGFTCVLLGIEESFPGLKGLIADAARIFGLPTSSFKCEAFCSSGSSGLAMHSDFDLNFALLLQGQKRWRLAKNSSIENQTSTCFGREVLSQISIRNDMHIRRFLTSFPKIALMSR